MKMISFKIEKIYYTNNIFLKIMTSITKNGTFPVGGSGVPFTTCLDSDEIFLFGLTSNRSTVPNTTFKCNDMFSCLNLLCKISDVPDVSMTCFMGSPLNNPPITRIIYTQSEYDTRCIIFILLLVYFGITMMIPICYYGYKLIRKCTRRTNYVDIL